MDIYALPDSEESEDWIELTGDDSATTESSTWKVEMYAAVAAQTERD